MQLRKKGMLVYIDDKDEMADLISQGYDWEIIDGKLIILETQTQLNLKDLKSKLTEKNATNEELCEIVNYLLDKML